MEKKLLKINNKVVKHIKINGGTFYEQKYKKAYWWNQVVNIYSLDWKPYASGYANAKLIDNAIRITVTSVNGNYAYSYGLQNGYVLSYQHDHVYLTIFDLFSTYGETCVLQNGSSNFGSKDSDLNISANKWKKCHKVIKYTREDSDKRILIYPSARPVVDDYFEVRNLLMFDLTAMFGEGKEPTAEQFRKMFPCDYYPYNAGEWRYASGGQYVNFNQLAINVSSNYSNTYSYEGIKLTKYDTDGLHLISTTNTVNPTYVALKNAFDKTHKYLLSVNAKYIAKGNAVAYIGFVAPNHGLVARTYITSNVDFNTYYTICDDMSNVRYITIGRFGQGSYNIEGNEIITRNPQLIDLTQMFGEGNEPTTVEEFKALYPNEYYDYVESRYEYTPGYYEDGKVVQHIPDTAFFKPIEELSALSDETEQDDIQPVDNN